MGCLVVKELTLVLLSGQLKDAEAGGVTHNIALQVIKKMRGTRSEAHVDFL